MWGVGESFVASSDHTLTQSRFYTSQYNPNAIIHIQRPTGTNSVHRLLHNDNDTHSHTLIYHTPQLHPSIITHSPHHQPSKCPPYVAQNATPLVIMQARAINESLNPNPPRQRHPAARAVVDRDIVYRNVMQLRKPPNPPNPGAQPHANQSTNQNQTHPPNPEHRLPRAHSVVDVVVKAIQQHNVMPRHP